MDYITIENLEVFAKHGVLQEENILGQKFMISGKLYYDFSEAASNDDIEKAVSYALVCEFIENYMKNNAFKLIETVADRLATQILKKFSLLKKVQLTVKKPWAPIGLHLENVMVTVERSWTEIFLSIGSNMGNSRENLDYVINSIANNDDFRDVCASEYIVTKPYGGVEQDDFLNGAVKAYTLLSPRNLLEYAHKLEADKERVRQIHWGPRTLDVDILFYGNKIITEPDLVIPHPDMANRSFVLEPMSEIAPYYIHPVSGKSITCMRSELEAK